MAAVVPPPPPPPPVISPAPPSDDDDDDDKSSSESSYSESDSDATPIPSSIPVPPPPPPAPASEPVTSADVAVDDAPAPAKDDRKLWERPWSLKELKNATECWTLAADAGLLLFMKEFSQKVVSKTHEIEKQVDSLIHEAKNTDTRAGNIFNDFMMLSNIQFVENRVYEENEDDDEERQEKEEGEKAQSEERPAEEKQMEVVGRIREAVSCGLKVLDEAFTKLEVQDEASSDEDDEETLPGYQEPILEAKDPYALRPMPYLIGTAGFFESEDVGIGEFESEGEEEEEEEEEYSTDEEEEPQARQQTRGLYEDDSSEELFEPSDKESEEDEKHGGVAEPFSGDSSSSDESSSSSGEFSSEDDEGGPKKPAMVAPVQMDLQAELAARLGVTPAAPVTTTTGEGSEFESSIAPSESVSAVAGEKHGKKKRKKKKKHKDKGLTEGDHGKSASKSKDAGPFMPDEDEDEGTPFGQDNIFGTSTTAKGLFDESDEEKESSGGFAAAISGKKSTEDADKESLHSSMSKTSKKKLPAGAVPLFGSSGLFTPEEEKSVTFDDTSTVKSEASPLITKKKSASSLFDNEDDEEEEKGLFSTKKKPSSGSKASPTTAPKPRRHKSSTSSDVFESSGLFSSSQPQEGTTGSPARKKKPVGGVSIFGPQPSLFTDSMKASKSSFGEDDSEAAGLAAEDSSVVSQPVITSTVKTAPTTTTTGSSGGMGLFDDSGGEEDLFAALSTQKSKPKGKPPVGGVSIFGGVTDELMDGTTSTAPESSSITAAPTVAPTKPVTSTVTSKKSGGLFSDGTESDEDGFFSTKSTTKPTTTDAPKTTSTEAAKPTSSASKDPFGLGSDEEDNLFSSAPTVSKPPPSVQPVKAKEPKTVNKPKSKGSKDIFSLSDDDDNMFASALTSKPKSPEKKHSTKTEQKTSTGSTSSVKKKPVARLGGLFDNDEDDDELFGSSNYGFGLGSSKPSTTKTSEPAKSSKPGLDLLSDNQSEDDGLFATKPSSTAKQPKESVPPPTAPKTKQTTATDDLFTAPVDSGNVGGEPSQSSPDVVTEPAKPQKKKPAGAVPMFGGVDLFGGGGGGAGIKDTIPATTAAPSVEEKKENVTTTAPAETKKPFGGLFGSPTSQDDEIFLFKPKKAPVKTPVSQPQPEQEDDLFGTVKPSKLKTPVSQPQPEQEDDLFGTVKPSKLKSTVSFESPKIKSPPTKAPTVEKSVSFEEPQKVDTLTNLTKNRAVRQGGRRPPSRQALKTRSSQSDDALAGFTTDTPTSSTQKISSKQFDAEPVGFGGAGSKPDAADDLFAASSTVLTPAGGSRSTTRKTKKPVARPTATKEPKDITKDILFGNDDLLAESPPKVTPTIVDQKRVTEIEKQIEKEIQEDDDLFSTKVLSKKVTSTIDDELFGIPTSKSTLPSVTTKSVPTALKVDDDDDDDELFPSDNKKKPVSLSAAATVTTSVLNKDDTDAPPPPHKLEGEDDDELFPSDDKKKAKKVVKKKKPTVTDEDLFGNTDDIFGKVPKDISKPATGKSTKAKTGKGKKKKKASSAKATAAEVTATTTTEPVIDVHDGETSAAKPQPSTTETSAPTKDNDFEDSLFGEAADNVKKAKAMKKKAKKKSEPKDYSIFDTDAPSIFDDPLNADK